MLGQHKGFVRYTKGQHKGLGLAIEPPLYVTKKDSATHAIYVGPSGALFTTELTAGEWNGIALAELTAPVTVSVKTRYSQREAEATGGAAAWRAVPSALPGAAAGGDTGAVRRSL